MEKRIRALKNRYWTKEENEKRPIYTLYFKDKVLLKFKQAKTDPEFFYYISDLLSVENDCIEAESIEDAMEQFEDMVVAHMEKRIAEKEEILQQFLE